MDQAQVVQHLLDATEADLLDHVENLCQTHGIFMQETWDKMEKVLADRGASGALRAEMDAHEQHLPILARFAQNSIRVTLKRLRMRLVGAAAGGGGAAGTVTSGGCSDSGAAEMDTGIVRTSPAAAPAKTATKAPAQVPSVDIEATPQPTTPAVVTPRAVAPLAAADQGSASTSQTPAGEAAVLLNTLQTSKDEGPREREAGTGMEKEASVASADSAFVSSSRHLTRGPDGRFTGSSTTGSAKPAGPPADSVEMRIYEEGKRLGYNFSPLIFFEKLALASPHPSSGGAPIADMEAFRLTMRRPGVQAMYKAEYERCDNPKRGAILKLFEVAGVDASVVKMERKRKRLAKARAAEAAAAAAASSKPSVQAPSPSGGLKTQTLDAATALVLIGHAAPPSAALHDMTG